MNVAQRTDSRSRGVLLTGPGLEKLRRSPDMRSATFEHMAEQVSLSAQTVARVWHAAAGVDRRTLERMFVGLGLDLTRTDYAPARAASSHNITPTRSSSPSDGAVTGRSTEPELIGRRAELDAIARQFGITRLVTITGPAGIGKTRLALATAERLFPGTPRALVDVARCSTFGDLETAMRTALMPYERPETRDARHRPRAVLIVDGCEPHLDACAQLVLELLTSDESLRIVATSREPLDVQGESECRLRGLGLPSIECEDQGRAFGSDAVRLFVAGAPMARGDLRLDDDLAAAISSIVRRVDGNPLAIERAAARSKMISCSELAARISVSLSILNDDVRALPARRPSLREIFQRAYARLSDVEQDVLRRMSVFADGWTADAASGVCKDTRYDVFGTLSSLVRKSFVIVDNDVAGRRYRLPAISRDYAHDELAARSEDMRASVDATRYVLELAGSAARAFSCGQAYAWFARMRAEHGNLERALQWSLQGGGEPELGARLAVALTHYWIACGRFDDGIRWLRLARASLGDEARAAGLRFQVDVSLARVLRWNGLPNQADAVARHAVRAGEEDSDLCAEMRFAATAIAGAHADERSRRVDLTAYATACRATGADDLREAVLALAEFELDNAQDVDKATALARESLDLARRAQHPFSEALALSVCARVADARGEHEHALAGGDRARALFMSLGNAPLGAVEIARTAAYRARLGRTPEAFAELARARRLMRPAGVEVFAIGDALATCLTAAARPTDAVVALAAVEAARRASGLSLTPREAARQAVLISGLSSMCGTRFAACWFAGLRVGVVDVIDDILTAPSGGMTALGRTVAN